MLFLAACSDEQPLSQRPPRPVSVVTVKERPYQRTIALTGEIAARDSASLSFKTGGRVDQIMVDVGDHVDKGTELARLDPAQQQADVAAAEAAVRSAEAQLSQATSNFDRQSALLKSGYTTRSTYDSAEEAVKKAQGALDAAKAELETARTALSDTVLRADAAGIITTRSVEPGQVVSAAQTVFGFAQDGARDAVFHVQEQLVTKAEASGRIRTIDLALVADPTVHTTGHVREVSPLIDPATGTVIVKVALDEVPPGMTLGAAVMGHAMSDPVEDAIVLPWQVLMADQGKPAVWVVADDNTVSLKPVVIARYDSKDIVIVSGLASGDRVVAAGSQLLRPGEAVEPKEEAL